MRMSSCGAMLWAMNEAQVIARLRAKIGTKRQGKFAEEIGVSQSFLSEVLKGSRSPTGKILDALGLDRVVTYKRRKA